MTDNLKQEVGKFYNEVGWQAESNGFYQNAQYEDLRPVSAEYIARAHARVGRHLAKSGRYLLDAGSGPVQYDAYLDYSQGYDKRVCFDLSVVAQQEARKRLGDKGFYVVGDIAHLPFKKEAFDGIVSLHTIHHLPVEEKVDCYLALYERLAPGRSMVTVDGWGEHKLRRFWHFLIHAAEKLQNKDPQSANLNAAGQSEQTAAASQTETHKKPAGTHVTKTSARWFKESIQDRMPFKILTWRSVSVNFLRTVIQPQWGGKFWLKVLYLLEEWFPRYFGENGQYPMIVVSKPEQKKS